MEDYGFREPIYKPLETYLRERRHFIQIAVQKSTVRDTECGFPNIRI